MTGKFRFLALAATSLLAQPAMAANLITNGSFETASGLSLLSGGSSAVPGWTTINDGVQWRNETKGPGNDPAQSGVSIIELAAFLSTGTPGGGIEQSFATIPGQIYYLSFFGITNNDNNRYGTDVINVLINNTLLSSFTVTHLAPTWNIGDWQLFTAGFLAAGSTTTLAFTNTQSELQHSAFIDSVSVNGPSATTPEPAAWITMIAGFSLIGAALRRRRRLARPVNAAPLV